MTRIHHHSAFLVFYCMMNSCLQQALADGTPRTGPLVSTLSDCEIHYSVAYSRYGEPTQSLLADVYRPKGEGPFPTILMLHGGAWFSGNKAHVSLHARHAAKAGYAVVAINYRLAPAHKFPKQLDDCRSALKWIAANSEKYGFDESRVAVYGYSAGAHLACLLGVTQNEPTQHGSHLKAETTATIRAIVAGGAPCEFSWIASDSERLAFWLGGSRDKMPNVYAAASPITFVDEKDPPTFFFHGKADRIVPISSAQKMRQQLEAKGVPSNFHTVLDANHLGAFVNSDARKRAIEFLDSQLKQTKPEE